MVVGIALLDSHPGVPCVGHAGEVRIERRAQVTEEFRQRVFEVAILAFTKPVPRHNDVAAEVTLVGIERRNGAALFARQKLRQGRAAVGIELACQPLPVICGHSCLP
jgi:hypothetical protein